MKKFFEQHEDPAAGSEISNHLRQASASCVFFFHFSFHIIGMAGCFVFCFSNIAKPLLKSSTVYLERVHAHCIDARAERM